MNNEEIVGIIKSTKDIDSDEIVLSDLPTIDIEEESQTQIDLDELKGLILDQEYLYFNAVENEN